MFSAWVETLLAGAETNDSQVLAWSTACESFVESADASDLVDLNRAAWGRPSPEFDQRWRRHLQESDPLFPLRGGDHKAATLAATAMLLASDEGPDSDLALLLRRCATAVDWRPSVSDLTVSQAQLADARRDQRVVLDWPTRSSFKVANGGADVAINTAFQNGTGVTAELLMDVVQRVTQSAGEAITRAHSRVRTVLEAREAPLLEQSDALIWVMSGASESLCSAWDDMSRLEAALASASEVNDLSRFPLGRPDAYGLIEAKVQSASKKDKAKEASLAQIQELMPANTSVADLTPLIADVTAAEKLDLEPTLAGLRLHDELNLVRRLGLDEGTEE
jgi:hypothetical protein